MRTDALRAALSRLNALDPVGGFVGPAVDELKAIEGARMRHPRVVATVWHVQGFFPVRLCPPPWATHAAWAAQECSR